VGLIVLIPFRYTIVTQKSLYERNDS